MIKKMTIEEFNHYLNKSNFHPTKEYETEIRQRAIRKLLMSTINSILKKRYLKMIDMKIDQYHITSNRYGLDVYKMKMVNGTPEIDDKGTIIESSIGHYGNLNNALKGLRRYIIRTGENRIANLDQYRKANQEVESMFDSYLQKNGVTEDE